MDKKRYGKVAEELNNQFLSGNNNYPDSIEAAMSVLSHRMDSTEGVAKVKAKKEEDDEDSVLTSFSQASTSSKKSKTNNKRKNVTCRVCGGRGHYANECPSRDSDNESSNVSWNGLQVRARTAFAWND